MLMYELVKTNADGRACGPPRVLSLFGLRFELWNYPGSVTQREHLIALATESPGQPVDFVACYGCPNCHTPNDCTGRLFSARVTATRTDPT